MATVDNAQFIATNSRARAIYTQGWEDGHRQGHQDGYRDAGDAAGLAARAYYAMEADEAHTRAFAKTAADALNVPRMAARPTPKPTLRAVPALAQFLDGLRRGGILADRQEVSA